MRIKTVNDLHAQDFYEAGAVFKRVHYVNPYTVVKMQAINRNDCGTVACMAGFYAIGNGLIDEGKGYHIGADKLAKDLGFKHTSFYSWPSNSMITFFRDNPDLWGNEHGGEMFYHHRAYGVARESDLTNDFIGDFLIAVGDRIKAKQTRFGRIIGRIKRCLRRL